MKIGVPKEIKNHEYRVGLTPAGVRELTDAGHDVMVQKGAGVGSGHDDGEYRNVGATLTDSTEGIFASAELIVKVKEPQPSERVLLQDGQTLFTYLHLAPDRPQTLDLIESGAICIAYETVTDGNGRLPLLAPMSEVAGRMAIQAGATCLEKSHGGRGVLLGGVPGVMQGRVVIIGGGVVGQNAAQMAVGLGAQVTVVDRNLDVLRAMDDLFGNRIQTLYSTRDAIENAVLEADLVIGAVLIPGASAPKLVTADMVSQMRTGTVLVDVAIDQGGCFQTSRPTTHDDPTYLVDDVVHYCVTNMPGAVARTSAAALNHATLPFVLDLANRGIEVALKSNRHLLNGLNVYRGHVTNRYVAEAHGLAFVAPEGAIVAPMGKP
ncbi:MAG: alanine dehydrogenase [Proteobacteria bacterium]|nr:alanine dehydrogenase [Pseudomonadota bacterium]